MPQFRHGFGPVLIVSTTHRTHRTHSAFMGILHALRVAYSTKILGATEAHSSLANRTCPQHPQALQLTVTVTVTVTVTGYRSDRDRHGVTATVTAWSYQTEPLAGPGF